MMPPVLVGCAAARSINQTVNFTPEAKPPKASRTGPERAKDRRLPPHFLSLLASYLDLFVCSEAAFITH